MAKILFIQNSKEELYGIMSIASYIKQRHNLKVAIGNEAEIIKSYNSFYRNFNSDKTTEGVGEIGYLPVEENSEPKASVRNRGFLKNSSRAKRTTISFEPNVVGIYVLTKDHTWALKTAKTIKSIDKNAFILLGGPHPTFFREILNDESVDAICLGEGEKPVLNLLDNIDNNKEYLNIPSLWIKKDNQIYKNEIGSILRAEELPLPDRTIYKDFPEMFQSEVIQVICSRGCPFNCFFCINYSLKKMYGPGFFRMRKIEDIINEILIAKKLKDVKRILFQDDIFGVNKIWLRNFLEQYNNKVKLPFYCLLRCDSVTEDLIDMLLEAGCYEVGIGIESGDKIIREEILNKCLSDESIKKAVQILHKKKMSFHTFNMFSLPNENLRSAWKTLKLNIKVKPDVAWSAIFQPYPGTKFCSDEVLNELTKPDFSRFKINYKYSSDFKYLQRLQKFFMLTVKFPIIQYLLPILVRLPLDKLYDKISKWAWRYLYAKKVGK